jgi:hypothetical protein
LFKLDVYINTESALKRDAEHKVLGDSSFMPWDFKPIKDGLTKSCTKWGVQQYAMILVAVCLFLRADELDCISFDNLLLDCCDINDDGSFDSLAFKVKGKSDKNSVILTLYSNKKNPDMCPVKHLLAHLRLSGIISGPMFRNKTNDEPISFHSFLRVLKSCAKFCNRSGLKFGTHTCRKTGYLLALFGGGDLQCVMQSARHVKRKTAMKYKQDALTMIHACVRSRRDMK